MALVEFAIFLPLFVLSFAVIVEFARILFSYQGAVVGVRDAARYLSRIAPAGVCAGQSNGSGAVLTFTNGTGPNTSDAISDVIIRNMDTENAGILPVKVRLLNVSSTYVCVVPTTAGTYRQTEVPIAQVSATFEIELPLGSVFNLNGITIPTINHVVTDQSRIYGV